MTKEKATYFRFFGRPRAENGKNEAQHRARSTRFLTKVCMWVKWMASPKQPQSMAGLKTSRATDISTKTHMAERVMIAVIFRHNPVMSAAPKTDSVRDTATAAGMEMKERKSRCMNFRYSSTISFVPTGSISLKTPDTKNTMPTR